MKRLLMLFSACGLAVLAPAAGLKDCFQLALKQSESLARSQEDVVQAAERWKQGVAAVLPTLALSDVYLHQDDHALTASQMDSNPADQNLLKATLAQPLFRGFREYQALAQLKAGEAAARAARQQAALQVYQDTAQAYFLVLSLERSRSLVLEQVKTYDDRIQELRGFQSIGRSRASDVLTAQAAQAVLKASAVNLDAQIRSARQLLAFITGQGQDLALDGTEPVPASAGDLDAQLKASSARPDLVVGEQRVEAARQGQSIAQGGHWPSADLLGNWYFQRPGSNSNINWDLSLVATLPLFQGGGVQSKAREAGSLLKQAELDLARQRRQVESDVRSLHGVLDGDLAQTAALEEAATLSEASYQALRRDYSHGLVTNLEVLQALNSARDAQRSLETARFAARNDQERLLVAAGLRLDLIGDRP